MADPAELIDRVGRAIYEAYPNRHGVPYAANRDVIEPMARAALAALTPTPSAEDAAVLMAFQAAAIDAYTQHDGPSELDAKREQLRAAVLSRMAGKAPPGYKIVPVEPTEEMLNAAIDAHGLKLGCIAPLGFRMSPQMMFEKSYAAMLAAAPETPR